MRDTILVVDDDPGIQQTIASILEDEGYAVLCAPDGQEALVQLDRCPVTPALVVLDMAMPVMDGYQFAEELSQRGLRPTIPIMIVTADGRASQKAARLGAEGYLAKPVTLLAFITEVRRLAPRETD